MDETLIIHTNGEQKWLVGGIETKSRKMRLDILPSRDSIHLKNFVNNHIKPGTTIVTDGWPGYNFLDNDENSVWPHEVYNHGAGNFGIGEHSTTHIENTWLI